MAARSFFVAVLAALLVGCGGPAVVDKKTAAPALAAQPATPSSSDGVREREVSPLPTPATSPAATSVPGALREESLSPVRPAQPSKPEASRLLAATVVRVVDGDTVEARLSAGRTETVRLIGVDTPETKHPDKPVQPYGPEASEFTTKRLNGQRVELELDVEERDRYGRLLAYLWLGEEMFNATLVRHGYAHVIPPNVRYADLFVSLQREAREAKRGLWGIDGSAPAPSMSAEAATTAPPVQNTSPQSKEVQIVAFTSPVSRGGTATLTAQAWPGAKCSITVIFKSGPSRAAGLGSKTAGGDGRVTWSWKVGSQTTPGAWPVNVECEGKRASAALSVR